MAVELVNWDLLQTREGSLDLMQDGGGPFTVNSILFKEYLNNLVPGLTALVSAKVIHNLCGWIKIIILLSSCRCINYNSKDIDK